MWICNISKLPWTQIEPYISKLTRLIPPVSQLRTISLCGGRVFSLSILWEVWWRAQPGTSLSQHPTPTLPSLQGLKWYFSNGVWTAPSHTVHQSLQTHCNRDTLVEGDFILIAEMLLGKLVNKSRVNATTCLSLWHVVNKYMNNSLHRRAFCSQGHSVWFDWDDCWTDNADKIEALVFLSTWGHEQIWWLLVYEGTISKTVIDISYDSAKLHIVLEAEKRVKETLFWTGGWNQNMLKLLYWECKKLSRLTAVNSYVFPISSGVKSKAMNT